MNQKKNISHSNQKNTMDWNLAIRKNLIFLSCLMIFIHLLGLIYQIIARQSTFSILLKELFIVLFVIQLILLKQKIVHTKQICYGIHIAIICISGFYMDFSSVIVSILTIFYLYHLNTNLISPPIDPKKKENQTNTPSKTKG